MGLPVNLILIRHAESEGNVAVKQSEGGDTSAFTPAYRARPSVEWRLTPRGREQAVMTGQWIREYVGTHFAQYYASDCLRALETAALLALPDAAWREEFLLRERDWGLFDTIPDKERQSQYPEEFARRESEPLFWVPPGGESFAHVALRVERVFDGITHGDTEGGVILVTHGDVMRAFRMRIERMRRPEILTLLWSEDPQEQIPCCAVIHYSRQHPETSVLSPDFTWMRCVTFGADGQPPHAPSWKSIAHAHSRNEQLLDYVNRIPPLSAAPTRTEDATL